MATVAYASTLPIAFVVSGTAWRVTRAAETGTVSGRGPDLLDDFRTARAEAATTRTPAATRTMLRVRCLREGAVAVALAVSSLMNALRFSDDAVFQGLAHGRRFRIDVQLFVDRTDVVARRVDADREAVGGGLVARTLREKTQESDLLRRQVVAGHRRRPQLAEEPDDLAGDLRRHRGAAFLHVAHGLEEFRRRRLLQQVARGPVAEGLEDLLLALIDAQHQDRDRRARVAHPRDGLRARHPRQVDVHEEDVGGAVPEVGEALQGVLRGAPASGPREPARAADQEAQALPEAGVVLDDGHADRRALGAHGHTRSLGKAGPFGESMFMRRGRGKRTGGSAPGSRGACLGPGPFPPRACRPGRRRAPAC